MIKIERVCLRIVHFGGFTWMFALFRLKLYDRLISPNVMN